MEIGKGDNSLKQGKYFILVRGISSHHVESIFEISCLYLLLLDRSESESDLNRYGGSSNDILLPNACR